MGHRRRGELDWTWFNTRSVNEACAGLVSVGATEVDVPLMRTKDFLPLTFQGSALVVGLGLLLLVVAQALLWRNVSGSHPVAGGLQFFGIAALAVGIVFGAIHLWGRRRSRVP